MDEDALLERARTAADTELTRLGSEKALLAATDATLDTETILAALATTLDDAADHLAAWAEATDDPPLADALADGATRLETARGELGQVDTDLAPERSWLGAGIGAPETDVGRAAAGVVGVPLVLDRLCLQSVSFFVNEADTERADVVRAVRDGVADLRDAHLAAVAEWADDADAAETAVEAAAAVVTAAYQEYADRLDKMGLDPKPVC